MVRELIHSLSDIFTTCKVNLQSGSMLSFLLQFVKKADRFADGRDCSLPISTTILIVNSYAYIITSFCLPVA
jgi:hypothetical protein